MPVRTPQLGGGNDREKKSGPDAEGARKLAMKRSYIDRTARAARVVVVCVYGGNCFSQPTEGKTRKPSTSKTICRL